MLKRRTRDLVQLFTAPIPTSRSTACIVEEAPLIQQLLYPSSTELSRIRSLNQKRKMQQSLKRQRIPLRKACFEPLFCRSIADIPSELGDLDWHTITPNEIYTRLSTSPTQGLSAEQAQRRLAEYGKNLPSPPPTHYFLTIFGYCFRGFGSILLVGSILVFVSWKPLGEPPSVANLALAIVLLAVFFIQAAFNAWQDWSSNRVMKSITTMLPDNCLIIRDGAQITLVASELVPGDILCIRSGNKLPADVRFVEISSDAKFDRSILTGKSLPHALAP
jgi:magnesium-transporting ATPase (P-type)